MASENEANTDKFAKLHEIQEELKSEMNDYSTQISELKERNKKLEEENEMLKTDLKECASKLEASTSVAAEQQTQLVNREGQLKEYSERVKNAEEENNRLKNEIRSLQQRLDTVQQNTNSDVRFCSTQANSAQPNSKRLPPFTFDLLCYLNRDQLERFSIVCRPLKNYIERYFHAKPYRIFDRLEIRGGWNLLCHNQVQWHPNREDYSVQQFLAGQKWSEDTSRYVDSNIIDPEYYPFAEMRPYLGPTVRLKKMTIYADGFFRYNPKKVEEMESIAYLWRDGDISIENARNDPSSYDGNISIFNVANENNRLDPEDFVAKHFQLILNSPTILQCGNLFMNKAHFSFKDCKVLYTVNVIFINYEGDEIDHDSWLQFLEQPGVKPIIVLLRLQREDIDNVLGCISKAFSSAVSPNAFKIAFGDKFRVKFEFEFRETNKTTGEILELKQGFPPEYQNERLEVYDYYTLERSSI